VTIWESRLLYVFASNHSFLLFAISDTEHGATFSPY
jgi:hypothetical protein